jgi:ATP-dependent DNA helicase RecG
MGSPGAATKEMRSGAAAAAPLTFAAAARTDQAQLIATPVRIPRPTKLEAPLTTLSGVGPKLAAIAAEAGIETIGDLLLRVPHSYRDRSRARPLGDLRLGEEATVMVEVREARLRRTRRRGLTIVEAAVADDSGRVTASWFNQPWLADRLKAGVSMLLVGSLDRRGFRVSEHEFLPVEEGGGLPVGIHTTGLVPVHPATEGLRPQRIREWVWQALGRVTDIVEPLPAELRCRRALAGAADCLHAVHFPHSAEDAEDARRRLGFEELFLYQAALASRRRGRKIAKPGPRLGGPGPLVERWITSLPFEPTDDQRRVFAELDHDLDSGEPMQRLLMGEVGSGKTVVALYAMLRALEAGWQAALMAPTETLAEQHAATLDRLLDGEAIAFGLLTGSTPAKRRRQYLARLASGELDMVVGTHALIEPAVGFARLGVCVVDEQHRFGVRQRTSLDAKAPSGSAPHLLHMTATPIPRTLSLTAYGDLDASVLRQLPAGRVPVTTWLVEEDRRRGAYEFVRERLREGRQAFIVCPLVSESEKLQAKAVAEEVARLGAGELRGFRIEALHGQMPAAAKSEVMAAFAAGRTQVLVATTVIEVGIDVPNASVMLVEGAERYGVSQLHQLRGRVGRGEYESHCLLFAEEAGELARRRLKSVASESDGFRLAEVDLSLRGEGEILGTRQHGLPRFAVASLPEDTATLIAAREEILGLMRRHGSLDAPELGPLMEAARRRFGVDASDPIPA